MRAIAPKKGEVRNPKGINGWSKLRERTREIIEDEHDDLMEVLLEVAKKGDTNALKLALGPVLDIKTQLHGADPEAGPVRFRFANSTEEAEEAEE